jgi:ankyrin repeat protein
MAATGIIRVQPWIEPEASEREALTLETVRLAVELGSDLNVANTDGRTALDGAKALKYDSVVNFLVEKGAKPGTGNSGRGAGRAGR